MALALLLVAVIGTDIALGGLVLACRGWRSSSRTGGADLPPEIAELIVQMRADLERAGAELGRQKTQLRRMLGEIDRQNAPLRGVPAELSRDVAGLAEQGFSPRAIAGRTGTSLEEVRIMLAMRDSQATA